LLRTFGAGAPHSIVLDSLDYPLVPLLSDFGIARALDVPELTHSGRTIGTPAFMAPEQCLGRRNIDHRADLYALGAVFYRCITGRQPFIGSTVQILHAHVYEPVTIDDEILRQLSQTHLQLLQRSLAKDPDDRYQSADEMAADLALGANPADLPLSVENLEQNTTMTLDLVVVGKMAASSGRSSVLVPSTTELKVQPMATAATPSSASPAKSAMGEPDVYYDRALDQRLRRVSGIILSLLLLLISFFLILFLLNLSLSDLWQGLRNTWQPLQSPVLAYSPELESTTPVVASGNGQGRRAQGVVQEMPATADDTRIALRLPRTPMTATVVLASTPCAGLPAQQFQPYIAQLDDRLQTEFRCATSHVVGGNGALLKFEHGFMLYLTEVNKMFVVNGLDQQWEDIDLVWLANDTMPPRGEIGPPEEGKFTPQHLFGKLWQNKDLHAMLGLAIMPEAARFPVLAQKFPGGWVVVDLERPAERFLFLRDQRRW
jgi:hypothetical protein